MKRSFPLEPETPPALRGRRVLVSAGRADPLIPVGEPERLAAMLEAAGATVTLGWTQAGHELKAAEVRGAREWLARQEWVGR